MNKTIYAAAVAALASLSISNNASAQIGKPFIHDPSSIGKHSIKDVYLDC